MQTIPQYDLFLLNKFQLMSDFFQDWFGLNNFDIAKYLRIVMIICFMVKISFLLLGVFSTLIPFEFLYSIVIILSTGKIIRETEQSVKNNPVFTNPAVIRYVTFRLLLGIITLLSLIFVISHFSGVLNPGTKNQQYSNWGGLFSNLADIFSFMVVYFSSCTPKPYKPSRARKLMLKAIELIRSLGKTPALRPTYITS
jgi:hypothetical protein